MRRRLRLASAALALLAAPAAPAATGCARACNASSGVIPRKGACPEDGYVGQLVPLNTTAKQRQWDCVAGCCVDRDECQWDHGGCHSLQTCTNAVGGFRCGACPAGWEGDAVAGCAVAKPGCADAPHGGCDPLTVCDEHLPGYSCGPCPDGYSGSGLAGCTPLPSKLAVLMTSLIVGSIFGGSCAALAVYWLQAQIAALSTHDYGAGATEPSLSTAKGLGFEAFVAFVVGADFLSDVAMLLFIGSRLGAVPLDSSFAASIVSIACTCAVSGLTSRLIVAEVNRDGVTGTAGAPPPPLSLPATFGRALSCVRIEALCLIKNELPLRPKYVSAVHLTGAVLHGFAQVPQLAVAFVVIATARKSDVLIPAVSASLSLLSLLVGVYAKYAIYAQLQRLSKFPLYPSELRRDERYALVTITGASKSKARLKPKRASKGFKGMGPIDEVGVLAGGMSEISHARISRGGRL